MKYQVVLTLDAQQDLGDIHSFVASQDGVISADRLLDGLQAALSKIRDFPHKGEYPPELVGLGIREFRQLHYKPYRAIYQVRDTTVYIMMIADGRRDMQALLQRRLLA